jgi:carboxyl-terminal processing protease
MNVGFPDVCNTPAGPAVVPVPYPNIAQNCQAAGFSPNVKICQMNALHVGSVIPITSGDEAGVAHPTIKGAGRFTQGNPVVKVNFMPAINLMCPSTGNNMNNALGAQTVPSVTNVLFTLARLGRFTGETPFWRNGFPPAPLPERLSGIFSREHRLESPRRTRDGAEKNLSKSFEEGARGRNFSPEKLLPREREVMELAATLDSAGIEARLGPGGVGSIRIPLLGFRTPTLVENAVERMLAEGLAALVIDLRGNRGGDLDAALRLADDFVLAGSLLCTLRGADGDPVPRIARRTVRYDMPLVVLIDGTTASAAEVLAGVLQSSGRAVLVGSSTWGKGCVQRLVPVAGGDGVTMADCGEIDLPGGARIHGRGLEADVRGSSIRSEHELVDALRKHIEDLAVVPALATAVAGAWVAG